MSVSASTVAQPTAQGVRVSNVQDARRVVDAVLDGRLQEFTMRLGRDGVHIVRPGTIFVYQANGRSCIARWTDGLKGYSGSTNRQGFLCYVLTHPPTGGPAWVRKSWSYTFDTPDGGEDTWNFVAYDYNDESHGQNLINVDELLPPPPSSIPTTPLLSPSASNSSLDSDGLATTSCSPLFSVFPVVDTRPKKNNGHRYMPYRRPSLSRSLSPRLEHRRASWPHVNGISPPKCALQRETQGFDASASTRRLAVLSEPSFRWNFDAATVMRFQ